MATQTLDLTQRLGLRLSQQQLRFVKLLEMTAPELEEAVDRELEDNPALGVSDDQEEQPREKWIPIPSYGGGDDDRQFAPVDDSGSLYDDLLEQLAGRDLPPRVEEAAKFIIGSLDPNGYLLTPLSQLTDDMAFGPGLDISEEEAQEALRQVQSLDPPGIGASSLQECLEIQLKSLPRNTTRDDALDIITKAYDAFTKKHRDRIMSLLRLDEKRTDRALALILTLNPKPGAALGYSQADRANTIIPDFTVTNDDGEIRIALNNRVPELRIERSFEEAMAALDRTPSGRPKKGNEFIVSRYNDARDFIRILSRRQETMMAVMSAIVKIQKEYFLTEDVYSLRPMMIKNVAEETGLDISVISRATNNKYVATPWGIFPLRFFFSDTISDDPESADAATNRKIEAQIASLVEQEDKKNPLSDRRIMEEMHTRGYELSRRTVAKYRDRIGIPVARLRKRL